MREVALWSFRHALVSEVEDLLEIAVLVGVSDNFALFPRIAEGVERLATA
jgi:hypothetical protein